MGRSTLLPIWRSHVELPRQAGLCDEAWRDAGLPIALAGLATPLAESRSTQAGRDAATFRS